MAHCAKLLILLSLTILYCTEVDTKPHDKNLGKTKFSKCDRNIQVDTICQKCAKITKSRIVYPMCCTDEEEVYRWCYSYLNFGLQKRTVLPPIIRENYENLKHHDTSKNYENHNNNHIG